MQRFLFKIGLMALILTACGTAEAEQVAPPLLRADNSTLDLYRPRVVKSAGPDHLYVLDCYGLKRMDRKTHALEVIAGADAGRFSPGDPRTDKKHFRDGAGAQALFSCPVDLVRDPARGKVYLADWGNAAIREVDEKTHEVRTIVGGPGWSNVALDGPRDVARLKSSNVIAMNLYLKDAGHLLVTDEGAIREVDIASGAVKTVVGKLGEFGDRDGVGTEARFPWWTVGLAPDKHGSLIVASFARVRVKGSSSKWTEAPATVLRKIDPATWKVTSLPLKQPLKHGAGGLIVAGSVAFVDDNRSVSVINLEAGQTEVVFKTAGTDDDPMALVGMVDAEFYYAFWRWSKDVRDQLFKLPYEPGHEPTLIYPRK
jgi:hypothetical protein